MAILKKRTNHSPNKAEPTILLQHYRTVHSYLNASLTLPNMHGSGLHLDEMFRTMLLPPKPDLFSDICGEIGTREHTLEQDAYIVNIR